MQNNTCEIDGTLFDVQEITSPFTENGPMTLTLVKDGREHVFIAYRTLTGLGREVKAQVEHWPERYLPDDLPDTQDFINWAQGYSALGFASAAAWLERTRHPLICWAKGEPALGFDTYDDWLNSFVTDPGRAGITVRSVKLSPDLVAKYGEFTVCR